MVSRRSFIKGLSALLGLKLLGVKIPEAVVPPPVNPITSHMQGRITIKNGLPHLSWRRLEGGAPISISDFGLEQDSIDLRSGGTNFVDQPKTK